MNDELRPVPVSGDDPVRTVRVRRLEFEHVIGVLEQLQAFVGKTRLRDPVAIERFSSAEHQAMARSYYEFTWKWLPPDVRLAITEHAEDDPRRDSKIELDALETLLVPVSLAIALFDFLEAAVGFFHQPMNYDNDVACGRICARCDAELAGLIAAVKACDARGNA